MKAVGAVLTTWAIVTMSYFIALNAIYLVFITIAAGSLGRQLRRRKYRAFNELFAYPFAPGITVILPAFNCFPVRG